MKKFIKFVWTKGSFYLRAQFILCCLTTIGLIVILIGSTPVMTNNQCKKYIIEHKDNIIKESESNYRLYSNDLKYYEEVTISIRDNSYYIIFWGDRDSWKWNIKLDKNFSANIPYKEYKNKNVKLDKKLLTQFK